MALIHLNYKSKYLDGNTDVNVLLPDLPFGGVPADFYSSGVLHLQKELFFDYKDYKNLLPALWKCGYLLLQLKQHST